MTNDIEALSLTLHGINGHFMEWPPNGQNNYIGHSSDSRQNFQKQNKKKNPGEYFFTPLCLIMGQNSS